MKYIILLTWFFLAACCKKTDLITRPKLTPSEIDTRPVNSVRVFEKSASWYIEAKVSTPKEYSLMVKVETTHADGKVWWFFVVIAKGKTETTVQIPASAGPVISWVTSPWSEWND